MTAPIEVLTICKLDGSSSVMDFVDLRLGGVILKGDKIIQQEGERAALAMPSIKTDRAWQNVIEITSKELRRRITAVALAEWQAQPKAKPAYAGSGREAPPWDDFQEAKRDLKEGPGWEDRR
jgi:DNA-binding cell septation regulator SpoVG